MSIPPVIVAIARESWRWQWEQLMKGLAPADKSGNFQRVPSQVTNAVVPIKENLVNRHANEFPRLIIGRSCPWAHRTWLVYQIRGLQTSLDLLLAKADHRQGLWKIEPSWLGCSSLLDLYKLCGISPKHRATVPAIIDPKSTHTNAPKLLGNESAQLIEVLNEWPAKENSPDLFPHRLRKEINECSKILQSSINDGVYKCGFARNQKAYENASEELFNGLNEVELRLSKKGPWLCGENLTLADIKLFPTLIRWEAIYAPLFKCSKKPLLLFPKICEWRRRLFHIPEVMKTCNSIDWQNDYFGALFPLNPSNIVPNGPDLTTIVNSSRKTMK
ncbi:glutathione S-transferase family protein [Prochlorococcus marinus]|uniref:Glutathione S-transferase C terminus n=1 Tax=Prochlorococcus marinus (strain MIT 9211) TaxID=93059 RepID=A9BDI8_PROM4|nr:glutathione S-transferase C-terminal domain-containing protein [Prochlorococcus marinus]ABX08174.1 Glutathione S-transferase C terminus [Prochlorococcus marinus str. MIT 9211]